MMLVFMFLIVFSIYSSIKNYASKYSVGLLCIVWSLIGLIYISMHKVACLDNYVQVNLFNALDYKLFMLIIKPRFSLFALMRMFNVFSALYMASLVFFSMLYLRPNRKKKSVAADPAAALLLLLLLLLLLYVIFYDPKIILMANIHMQENPTSMLNSILTIVDTFLWACVLFIFLIPWIILFASYKKISSPYVKKQIIGVSLFVLFANFMYIIIFRITNMRTIYFFNDTQSIIRPEAFKFDFSQIYIILMFICIGCMLYIFNAFNISRADGFLKKIVQQRRIKNKHSETHQVLHSAKNMIIAFRIQLEDAMRAKPDEQAQALKLLHASMSDYLDHISSLVSADHQRGDFWQEKIFAEDFMDGIIEKTECPSSITIEKLYKNTKNTIYIDSFYLNEAVTNIINNAIQATQSNGGKSLKIDIKQELTYITISITDEGGGIPHKIRKSIFKPFFTTKSINTNWGVGLSYSLEIINMHNGKISFKSKEGVGTTFFILLPKSKQSKKSLPIK